LCRASFERSAGESFILGLLATLSAALQIPLMAPSGAVLTSARRVCRFGQQAINFTNRLLNMAAEEEKDLSPLSFLLWGICNKKHVKL
jgi:hypothetical protein